MAQIHDTERDLVAPEPTADAETVIIPGVAAAPGIAIAQAFVYSRDLHLVEERTLDGSQIEAEIERFTRAVDRAERELEKIAAIANEKLGLESAGIFEAQAMMLRDSELYDPVIDLIREQNVNADFAVQRVMTRHRQLMEGSDSEYLRERSSDLLDLQERIIRHLRRGKIIAEVQTDSIVISENLTAADIVLFSRRGILGCATAFGGPTSHVSIMARALEVPAVVSAPGVTEAVNDGDIVVIDGVRGEVIIRPNRQMLRVHKRRQQHYRRLREEQKELVSLPADTLDGRHVSLQANLEFQEELALLPEYGAEGIGLFRTEILVLMQRRMVHAEEDQYRIYRSIIEAASPHETVLRVLDLGGDKMLPLGNREHNPYLGWRGIRILLDKPDILIPQLRAILRAAVYGPAKLLLPMITDVQEIRRFRRILDGVKDQLREERVEFDADIPIGIMVEVPAVALLADTFAREVDFFSIGTNDLTQYTLAVDRGNDLVANRYDELHPAVLSLIKKTIDAGRAHGIDVSMCGELAGNARATPILYGLGLRAFSASPTYLPEVKRIIRSIHTEEAEELAERALACSSAEDVNSLLTNWLESHSCGLISFFTNGGDDGSDAN